MENGQMYCIAGSSKGAVLKSRLDEPSKKTLSLKAYMRVAYSLCQWSRWRCATREDFLDRVQYDLDKNNSRP